MVLEAARKCLKPCTVAVRETFVCARSEAAAPVLLKGLRLPLCLQPMD